MEVNQLLAYAALTGLLVHQIFKRSEPSLFQFSFYVASLFVISPVALYTFHVTLWLSPLLPVVHLLTLGTSIITYRLAPFHPLASFPGPLKDRISKIFGATTTARGQWPYYVHQLHQRYGDFVRVGPNELSVNNVDAITAIYGPGGLVKGPFYDAFMRPEGAQPMFTIRGHAAHHARRQVYNRAFQNEAMNGYKSALVTDAEEWLKRLREVGSQGPVDMHAWLGYFTFDFMGELLFGGSFNMTKEGGDPIGMWPILNTALDIFALFGNIPWLTPILALLPANDDKKRWQHHAVTRIARRTEEGAKHKDMFHYLMGEDRQDSDPPLHPFTVLAEVVNMMIAGSDTTSVAMTFLLYYILAVRPECYKTLVGELDSVFPPSQPFPMDDDKLYDKLADCQYLNACINECMRLAPPVPRGMQRFTGPKGAIIVGKYIPPNTSISVPTYSIHRDERCFSPRTLEFCPERWYEDGWKNEKLAFLPFLYGPYGCAGKNLAYHQMRLVIASLMHEFTLELSDSWDRRKFETSFHENFGIHIGAVDVKLTGRKDVLSA
ncbi:cytochrome P450 [Atractiella rhizophila]|nr:cytochrome P450 [Atractiella rhizophila]